MLLFFMIRSETRDMKEKVPSPFSILRIHLNNGEKTWDKNYSLCLVDRIVYNESEVMACMVCSFSEHA